jgi:PEP-CTERM motif
MKKILASIATLVATAALTQAAVTITLSGNPTTGPQFTVSSGFVPDGSLVRIGTFATAPSANALFSTLESSFREFGRTTMGHTTSSAPVNQGRINRSNIAGIDGGTSPDGDSSFIGAAVYIWVYNSATANAAVQQGIFSTAQNTFLDQSTSVALSVNQFRTAIGKVNESDIPAGVTINSANNLVTSFSLSVPVPEPTTSLTLMVFALAGAARRRR